MNYIECKEIILNTFREVLNRMTFSYDANDSIFSHKYNIASHEMVYILLALSNKFHFKIDECFIDSLEECSFGEFEKLIFQNTDMI